MNEGVIRSMPLITGVYFLVLLTVHAQKSVTEEVVDYGPAFERLVKLGLPDAKGAKYVKLTLHANGQNEGRYYSGYGGSSFPKRSGDAWLLAGGEDGKADFIHQFYQNITVIKKKKRGGLMRALVGKEKTPQGTGALGEWKTIDVAKDTLKMMEGLDDMQKKGRVFDAERWGYDESSAKMASKVLVMACHIYRAGHVKEGNMLAQKILSLSPFPEKVIDGVVNQLADQQYSALVSAFFKSKDWQAYHDGLSALSKRYPRGWNTRLGAQILLPKIMQSIKGEKGKLHTFTGVTLKPEAVKILDELLTRTEPVIVSPTAYWLIADPTQSTGGNYSSYGGRQSGTEEWLKKLCALGMDGFIALAAAAGDDVLIATSMQVGGSNYYSRNYGFSSNFGSGRSIDELAVAAYASMRRPCTRGEIARSILISTMPNPDNDLAQKAPEQLRDIAYQWWLAHRGDSKSTLARHMMEGGDRTAQQVAVMTLIQSGTDADAKVVEDFIMSSGELSNSIQLLEPYLKARKGKARSFFNQFSEVLKDIETGGDAHSLPWNVRQAGGVDKFLKKLSIHVDDVSVDKVLADIKSGKTPIKEGLTMLDAAASGEDSAKLIPTLVSLAAEKEKLIERAAILQNLMMLNFKAQQAGKGGQKDEDKKKRIAALTASKEDWKILLKQTAKPQNKEEERALNQLSSISVYAAWCVETIYFPENTASLRQIAYILGTEKMDEFMLRRANGLLENPESDDFPNPKKVGEKRSAEIRKDITKLKPLDVIAYYEELPLQEKLAWVNILSGFEGDMPDSVTGMNSLIAKVSWINAPKADAAYKKLMNDLMAKKEFSKKLADRIIALLAKDPEKHAEYMFVIQGTGQVGQGLVVSVMAGKNAQLWKDGIIEAGVELIEGGAVTSMAGIGTYSDDGWLTGAKYSPKKGAPDESETIKNVIENILENITSGKRFSVVFYTETEAHLKKMAESEDTERILPAP